MKGAPALTDEELSIGHDALWVDADAVFKREPEVLPEFSQDFAVRINEDLPIEHPSKIISGTVYANWTEGADRLLRLWAACCHEGINQEGRKEEFWDQVALRKALYSEGHGASFTSLPLSYTKIFDHPGDEKLSPYSVIEHYQASRRYKKMI
ncbi:MAG: hypothetical protein HYZ48_02850 [Chlamydiales bacterium]|nr:hypothetical protein [Chlamydiales bacterium]